MRLLALVESPDHVCYRYRIRAFESALKRRGWTLECQPLRASLPGRVAQLIHAAAYDAVILQRKLLAHWELSILGRSAKSLIFDFDDAVLYRDSYHRRGPYSRSRARRFARVVGLADAIIAGNDFLADCASRSGAPAERVRVIPTCVDPSKYPPASTPPSGPLDETVDLVWIGSSSTLQGIENRRSLWERLGSEVQGIRMRVICDRFPRFECLPVVPVPWDEQGEALELSRGQIGISWIPDDIWSRGKCGLKILQYQMAGLPVVANPIGTNTELVEGGVTGFLAETDEEWITAIRTLAEDAKLRRQMGATARQRSEAGFSVEAWADTFVDSVTNARQDEPKDPILRGSMPAVSSNPLGRRPRIERASSSSPCTVGHPAGSRGPL